VARWRQVLTNGILGPPCPRHGLKDALQDLTGCSRLSIAGSGATPKGAWRS
jgi:hypothetical protein